MGRVEGEHIGSSSQRWSNGGLDDHLPRCCLLGTFSGLSSFDVLVGGSRQDVCDGLLMAGDHCVCSVHGGRPVGEGGEEGDAGFNCGWLNKSISHHIGHCLQIACDSAVALLEQGGEVGEGCVESARHKLSDSLNIQVLLALSCCRGDHLSDVLSEGRSLLGHRQSLISVLQGGAVDGCWLDPRGGGLLQIFYSELDAVLILVNCSR